jgi:hypothetical protein
MVAGTPTLVCLWWTADPVHVLGCSSSRAECALEIPLCTSAAWELLVALGLGLCTVAARDRSPAGRLWDYALDGQAFLVVLVSSMDSVVSLEQVSGDDVRICWREKKETGLKTYRRAKLMWQVKHLKGLTLVSAAEQD